MEQEKRKIEVTPRQLVFVVVAIPLSIFCVWHVYDTFQPFIHHYFGAGAGEAPPPPASSSTVATVPGADVEQDLAALDRTYGPAAIRADPLAALRAYVKVARERTGTAAARAAQGRVAQIRIAHTEALAKANRGALEDVARVISSSVARLEKLDHLALVRELGELEQQFAGLPAADKAGAEKERIDVLWASVPEPERRAREAYLALAPDPVPAAKRTEVALEAHQLATRFAGTRYGKQAAARRDELLDAVAREVEEAYATHPDGAPDLAGRFPASLLSTPAGTRVASAREHAEAERAKAISAVVGELRARRARGDFAGATALLAKLRASEAADEKAAIDVFSDAAKGRLPVPAGAFLTGPADAPTKGELATAFEIDRREVTNGAFRVFVRETGATPPCEWDEAPSPAFDRLPVSGVTQGQAAAFARWLGARLPTALEWERAARGTDGRRYPWGSKFEEEALNFGTALLKPAGSFPRGTSPLGAVDMAGNVAEWTSTVGPDGNFAVKGGSKRQIAREAFECSAILWLPADKADAAVGFRCAWDAAR